MQLPKWLVPLLGWLLVIAVPPFLVLTNVNLFMTPQFVFYEYGKRDFPRRRATSLRRGRNSPSYLFHRRFVAVRLHG